MPQTSPYGFEFEIVGQQPGRTLHGGDPPSSPILAEQVNDEIERVDVDVSTVQTNVDNLDAEVAWKRIAEGTHTGSAFSIPVPSGEYSQLKLNLRGHLDGIGTVRLRINDDTSAGHRTMARGIEHNGTIGASAQSDEANQWICAHWASTAGNTCTVHLYVTDVTANVGYDSFGQRMSADRKSVV